LDIPTLTQLTLGNLQRVKGSVSINTPNLCLPSMANLLFALKVTSTNNNNIVSYTCSSSGKLYIFIVINYSDL